MNNPLRLTGIFAHPDDESLGMGGTLAKYATEAIQISLISATRGERGWNGPPEDNPGLHALGQLREQELCCAAAHLGIREVSFLDYIDGDLDQADPHQAISQIVTHLRQFRPQVVVTFGPEGSYGHPDHIAISQLTSAAVICAADNSFLPGPTAPHRVDKFYYVVDTLEMVEWVKTEFGGIHFEIDGVKRDHTGWKDWAITTRIDSRNYWETVVEAIRCHQSQLPAMPGLLEMTPEQHQLIWGTGNFYRVFSLVNGGRKRETDIFEGLR